MTDQELALMAVKAGIIPWTQHQWIGQNKWSATDEGLDGDFACLVQLASMVADHEREKVAQWIMAQGYATGHGDTIEDMLNQLDLQAGYERGFIDGMQKQMQSSVDRAVNAMSRQWVGLTDEEQNFIYQQMKLSVAGEPFWVRFANAIEQALKEKNT